ncbi:MAG: bacterial ammonia monooxygenase, subunit AmoB [Methylococcales bacterium]
MKKIHYRQLLMIGLPLLLSVSQSVFAHGERALEPFIRMRTIQWYDIGWSKSALSVNEEIVLSGRFHVAEDWPNAVPKPDSAFLNLAIPTPVLVRIASVVNGVNVNNSMGLQLGADYEFKILLKGRVPGRYHIHPMMNLKDIGVIVGPGAWIEVNGTGTDFTNPVTTIAGQTVDLETFGTSNGVFWHGLWLILAAAWLIWWLQRPLFIPRYRSVLEGREEILVTPMDHKLGKIGIVATLVLVTFAYLQAEANYPDGIPLQTGRTEIEPLAIHREVEVRVKRATYAFDQRSFKMTLEITNHARLPIQIGEFDSPTVRFFNRDLERLDPKYPAGLGVEAGLQVEPDYPIAPGTTARLKISATDAAWHNEKLSSITKDTDSKFGGLLFFYDSAGTRYLTSISGFVIPVVQDESRPVRF